MEPKVEQGQDLNDHPLKFQLPGLNMENVSHREREDFISQMAELVIKKMQDKGLKPEDSKEKKQEMRSTSNTTPGVPFGQPDLMPDQSIPVNDRLFYILRKLFETGQEDKAYQLLALCVKVPAEPEEYLDDALAWLFQCTSNKE